LRTCDSEVADLRAKRAIRMIAAYSTFGISLPLTSLMRGLGLVGVYDSALMGVFNYLADQQDVLKWYEREGVVQDQAIGFSHRLLAAQLLRRLDVKNWAEPLEECWPILTALKPTSVADNWLLETLVFEALRPSWNQSQERLRRSLESYQKVPSILAERSQPTQHHWARTLQCLSRSEHDLNAKVEYLLDAIGKLVSAVDLAANHRGRENPRNVFNTLGAVYAELSRHYRAYGSKEAESSWLDAANAFDRAMGYGADNLVTLSAFADRLVEHGRDMLPEDVAQATQDLSQALTLLTRASETPGILPEDEMHLMQTQMKAYEALDSEAAASFFGGLRDSSPELWGVTFAHRKLKSMTADAWRKGDAKEFSEVFEILNQLLQELGSKCGWRLLYLLYKVTTSSIQRRYDFSYRLQLLDRLAATEFRWDSKLRFAHCVLCYQSSDFPRGQSLFRSLRGLFNSGDLEPRRLVSFWRSEEEPSRPRIATVRVNRVDNDWRAYGEVAEMQGQSVLLRPRWFDEPPTRNQARQCFILFETYGPIAVPVGRHVESLID